MMFFMGFFLWLLSMDYFFWGGAYRCGSKTNFGLVTCLGFMVWFNSVFSVILIAAF